MDFVTNFIKPKVAALINAHEANTPSSGAQALLFELNALVDTASKMFTSQLSPASPAQAPQYHQQLQHLQQQLPPPSQPQMLSHQQSQHSQPSSPQTTLHSLPTSSSSSSSSSQQMPTPFALTPQQLQQQQRLASARFASQTAYEVKSMLSQVRKVAITGSRAVALFQAVYDIVVFRIQLHQFYAALGSRRLRSLSMERASLSITSLAFALDRSPLATFDPHIAALARCEAKCLAALLRAVSHTARMQFVPALLSVAEARGSLTEWTNVQMGALKLQVPASVSASYPAATTAHSSIGNIMSPAAQSPRMTQAGWQGGGDMGGSASMTYGAVSDVGGAMCYSWIHEWLDAFVQSCLGNIELVFNQHLTACIGPSLASISMTPKASLVQLIEAFIVKSEAQAFALVLDCNRAARASVRTATTNAAEEKPPPITFSVDQPFIDAFALSATPTPSDPPTGLASFPVIFVRPATTSFREHMPNVVSIILDQAPALLSARTSEPLLHTDGKLGQVFALIRMGEPHLFGVTVWMSRAPRNIDYAMRLLPHIASLSRHSALFDAVHDAATTKASADHA